MSVMPMAGWIRGRAPPPGIFLPPDPSGHLSEEHWARTPRHQHHRPLQREPGSPNRIWQAQQLNGSLVATTSANAVVAKRGSVAYDASKAAANHVIRELAVELAPLDPGQWRGPGHRRRRKRHVSPRSGHRPR